MNDINLTVIIIDGESTGKFYLSYLFESGFKIKKLIILKKCITVKSFIKKIIRFDFFKVHDKKQILERKINSSFKVKIPENLNYSEYASSVVIFKVGDKIINDDKLFNYLTLDDSKLFLFSGGGIVNARLLSNPNKRIIHIHPGIVPDVRGADCLFWSVLLRGKPGYSLFYMSEAIDEGAILHQEEFEILHSLCIDRNSHEIDVRKDSNSLLKTLDLHYRSITLVNFLNKHYQGIPDINISKPLEQNKKDGRMYFFMHREIKKIAIERLLFSDES